MDVATVRTEAVNLSELDDEQRYQRFDRLQRNMPRVWDAMRLNLENESVVVVPSVTLDRLGEGSGSMTQAYEERFLFLLLLLREPCLDGVRDVDTDRTRQSRVLPGPATWRDPQPCPCAS